jgi:hypothetical protein
MPSTVPWMTRRRRALIGIGAPVGQQTPLPVEQLPVQLLTRQATPAALTQDIQHRFGALHDTYFLAQRRAWRAIHSGPPHQHSQILVTSLEGSNSRAIIVPGRRTRQGYAERCGATNDCCRREASL